LIFSWYYDLLKTPDIGKNPQIHETIKFLVYQFHIQNHLDLFWKIYLEQETEVFWR